MVFMVKEGHIGFGTELPKAPVGRVNPGMQDKTGYFFALAYTAESCGVCHTGLCGLV